MKKLFLAIAAHEGLEEAGAQILKKLRINADQKQLEIRWVPQNNFHVTLVFLGPTDEAKLPEIEALTAEVASLFVPFYLKIANVGAFPDDLSSRVLWFGVQNSKALRALQEHLFQKFKEPAALGQERDYSPHLTIGRLRNPHRTRDLLSPFVRKKIAKIPVREIVLYESLGGAPFPVYKALKTFPLTGEKELSEEEAFSEVE